MTSDIQVKFFDSSSNYNKKLLKLYDFKTENFQTKMNYFSKERNRIHSNFYKGTKYNLETLQSNIFKSLDRFKTFNNESQSNLNAKRSSAFEFHKRTNSLKIKLMTENGINKFVKNRRV